MNALEWLRQEYALHPEFAHEIEALAAAGGSKLEQLLVAEGVQFIPLGGLVEPLLAKIAAAGDAQLQARLDAWLEGYVQARPDVHIGQLQAGLLSIEEVPTPKKGSQP
jgi:hypothetical protein